jgi:hypothetical protein
MIPVLCWDDCEELSIEWKSLADFFDESGYAPGTDCCEDLQSQIDAINDLIDWIVENISTINNSIWDINDAITLLNEQITLINEAIADWLVDPADLISSDPLNIITVGTDWLLYATWVSWNIYTTDGTIEDTTRIVTLNSTTSSDWGLVFRRAIDDTCGTDTWDVIIYNDDIDQTIAVINNWIVMSANSTLYVWNRNSRDCEWATPTNVIYSEWAFEIENTSGDMKLLWAELVAIDSVTQEYIIWQDVTTAPTNATTQTQALVRDPSDWRLYLRDIWIRISSEVSSATPTINSDNVDIHRITALAVDVTSFTTNLTWTPTHWQSLIVEITGTAGRGLTRWADFESSTVLLPITTFWTNMLMVWFKWNSATNKWRCVAVA